jgi:hypothetical protein
MNTFAVSFLVRPSKSTKAFFIAFKTDTTVTKANHLSRNKKNNFCPAYLNTCRTKVIHSRLHHAQKQSVRFHLLIKRLLNQLHDIIQFIHIRNTDFYIAIAPSSQVGYIFAQTLDQVYLQMLHLEKGATGISEARHPQS